MTYVMGWSHAGLLLLGIVIGYRITRRAKRCWRHQVIREQRTGVIETTGLPDGVVPQSVSVTPPGGQVTPSPPAESLRVCSADGLPRAGELWLSDGVELGDYVRWRYGLSEPDADPRFAAVEARQRAYGMHDPSCPTFRTEQAQERMDMLLVAELRRCDCWLSREPKEQTT